MPPPGSMRMQRPAGNRHSPRGEAGGGCVPCGCQFPCPPSDSGRPRRKPPGQCQTNPQNHALNGTSPSVDKNMPTRAVNRMSTTTLGLHSSRNSLQSIRGCIASTINPQTPFQATPRRGERKSDGIHFQAPGSAPLFPGRSGNVLFPPICPCTPAAIWRDTPGISGVPA